MIPTHNRAHTLARALSSVFEQTRAADEVIVVDDGSTDDTGAVVRGFPRARLIRLEANRGAAAARNAGVRQARGDYIAFLDSDDAWVPSKLQAQLAHAAAWRDRDLVCTGIVVHRNDGSITRHPGITQPREGWNFADFLNYPFSPSTWLVKAAALARLGGFDETLANCEDLDLLARMTGSIRIDVMPEQLTLKYNLCDSLDADPARRGASLAVLARRHPELWTAATLALTYQRLANLHFDRGDSRAGRAALLEAARQEPWRARRWALLALSLLGHRAYNAVRERYGSPRPAA